MYIPWNWEFGSALPKRQNFGGVLTPPPLPLSLGVPLLHVDVFETLNVIVILVLFK
jgi:hypothetical protein